VLLEQVVKAIKETKELRDIKHILLDFKAVKAT
jgi:hypothetical protein